MPAPSEEHLLATTPTRLFVGGAWQEAMGGRTYAVEDPSRATELLHVADAAPEDGARALDAAVAAQADWARTTPRHRSDILRAAFDLVRAREEELALLITLEMGKPLAESRREVRYGAEFLRWYAEQAVRIGGRWTPAPDGGSRIVTMQQPVGPCLVVTPWNFPLAMGTRKIGPAIAAGCTMVVKPAPQTPLTMLALAQILDEAGLPAGVCNVVPTSEARELVTPLMSDPRLRKVTFTGSTAVGRTLSGQAGHALLRQSMELGGNAPFLVFADADLERAVEGAMAAKMRNMGEACTAANRFLVHRSRADEFVAELTRRMSAQRLGRGTEEGVTVGPLIDSVQNARVARLVDQAVAAGATCLTGGTAPEGPGHFYEPTVLVDVAPDAALLHEEIFGPVAPVTVFDDDEEAVSAANATDYGLAAYVFTADLDRALRTVEALEVGMVGVNQGTVSDAAAPFGGIKASGFGREGGPEGIEEYLSTKYAGVAL